MDIWVRYVQRVSGSCGYKDLATVKMDSTLVPQMGDQVGIDHRAYQVTERTHPNISTHIDELCLDPDAIHLYIGVEPIRDRLYSFDPNVGKR